MGHILITMRRTLRQLEDLGPVDADLLARNSTAGLVVERVLANLMDMAFDINCLVARCRPAPRSFAESCERAVEAGLIDDDLAHALVPEEGPHHVVMQLSLDTDPGEVEMIVAGALSAFQEFERRAIEWSGRDGIVV